LGGEKKGNQHFSRSLRRGEKGKTGPISALDAGREKKSPLEGLLNPLFKPSNPAVNRQTEKNSHFDNGKKRGKGERKKGKIAFAK